MEKPKDWKDIPQDVHEALRNIRWYLERYSVTLRNEAYACEYNREGIAMDFGFLAEDIDALLCQYGLPSKWAPHWLTEPETEAEAIERDLLKKD